MSKPIEKIYKPQIQAPFRQRQYLELMKQKVLAAQTGSYDEMEELMEEIRGMVDVLIEDDNAQMIRQLPEQYWAIMSNSDSIGQIGSTADPDDMWEEEPYCWIKPITKEEFDRED